MSKFVLVHQAKIKDCKLIIANLDKWRSSLMNLDGQEVRITIDNKKESRSSKQNRLYWKFLEIIENETGNNADDIHEIAKRKFLPPRFVKAFGQEIKLPATTTKLDSLEFTNYLDKISAWCGISVPNPDDICV